MSWRSRRTIGLDLQLLCKAPGVATCRALGFPVSVTTSAARLRPVRPLRFVMVFARVPVLATVILLIEVSGALAIPVVFLVVVVSAILVFPRCHLLLVPALVHQILPSVKGCVLDRYLAGRTMHTPMSLASAVPRLPAVRQGRTSAPRREIRVVRSR